MLDSIYNILRTAKHNSESRCTWDDDSALEHTAKIILSVDNLLKAIECEIEDETLVKNTVIELVCIFLKTHKENEEIK